MIIVEFHGIGHINFSEYKEEMKDKIININGRQLIHLGTYGKVFDNDMIKRNYILTKYPWVEYYIIWTEDLINENFKKNALRRSQI